MGGPMLGHMKNRDMGDMPQRWMASLQASTPRRPGDPRGRNGCARGARDTVERPSRRVLRSRLDAWIAPSGDDPHPCQHAEDQESRL